MLCEESPRLRIIDITRHDKETDPGSGFPHYIQKVLDQTLENVDMLCQTDIIHTLRVCAPEACAHTACEKYGTDFSFADRLKTDARELLFSLFNLCNSHRG